MQRAGTGCWCWLLLPGALQSGERAADETDVAQGGPPASGAPRSDLTASPVVGSPPLQVAFTDLSSNNPTSWIRDFGDLKTSTDPDPVHEYTVAGN